MKAVLLEPGLGSLEQRLKFVNNHPTPLIASDQLLVRVKACAVDDLDVDVCCGLYSSVISHDVFVPGYAVAGTIEATGREVEGFHVGQDVVGLISLSNASGGFAEFAAVNAVDVVPKPATISFEDAASILLPGIRAYTAFFLQMHLKPNHFLLIVGDKFAPHNLAIELAASIGAKIIITAHSPEQLNLYQDCCSDSVVRVVDVSRGSHGIMDTVLQETGGIGVDCVLDLQNNETFQESEKENQFVTSSAILSMLAPHAHWSSSRSDLQSTESHSNLLHQLGASVSYLNVQTWVLAPTQQGRFIHILVDLFRRIEQGQLRPGFKDVFSLEKIRHAHRCLRQSRHAYIVVGIE